MLVLKAIIYIIVTVLGIFLTLWLFQALGIINEGPEDNKDKDNNIPYGIYSTEEYKKRMKAKNSDSKP